MTLEQLPAHRLNAERVFQAPERRLSYQVARFFYVILAVFIVLTAALVTIPNRAVPQSKPYQEAAALLRKNRILKLHLGSPLRVAPAPESYRKEGSLWRFLVGVSGSDRAESVLVTVEERGDRVTVLEARFQGLNLVTGRQVLKDPKKPR